MKRVPFRLAETYSVLTRLPGDARVAAAGAVRLLETNLGPALAVPAAEAAALPGVLAPHGIAGGAVYDALVGLAAHAAGIAHWSPGTHAPWAPMPPSASGSRSSAVLRRTAELLARHGPPQPAVWADGPYGLAFGSAQAPTLVCTDPTTEPVTLTFRSDDGVVAEPQVPPRSTVTTPS